jgi:hypothetical protein
MEDLFLGDVATSPVVRDGEYRKKPAKIDSIMLKYTSFLAATGAWVIFPAEVTGQTAREIKMAGLAMGIFSAISLVLCAWTFRPGREFRCRVQVYGHNQK